MTWRKFEGNLSDREDDRNHMPLNEEIQRAQAQGQIVAPRGLAIAALGVSGLDILTIGRTSYAVPPTTGDASGVRLQPLAVQFVKSRTSRTLTLLRILS